MDLRDSGYELQEDRVSRRIKLKNLIGEQRFDIVFRKLRNTKENVEGLEEEKARNDLNWLLRRYNKGMYDSTKNGFEDKIQRFNLQILEEYDRRPGSE